MKKKIAALWKGLLMYVDYLGRRRGHDVEATIDTDKGERRGAVISATWLTWKVRLSRDGREVTVPFWQMRNVQVT